MFDNFGSLINNFDKFGSQLNNPDQSITQAQWKEFLEFKKDYIKKSRILNFLLQGIKDTLEGRILPNNIHRDAILTRHIKARQITDEEIEEAAIKASKIANDAVTEGKILAGAVIGDKIATDAVTSAKIQDGAVIAGKIAIIDHIIDGITWTDNHPSDGFIAWEGAKVIFDGVTYTITNGNTNLKYVWWDKSESTTTFQISDTVPTLTDDDFIVAINASGTHHKIWGSTIIDGGAVRTGTIDTGQLAADAITTEKIAASSITTDEIAASAITSAKMSVTELSAICANLGTIDAGIIDGAELRIGGSETTQEIYFKDSEVYFYDYHTTNYQKMAFRYGALDFSQIYYYSGASKQTGIYLSTPNVATNLLTYDDGNYFKIDINNGLGAFSVFTNGTVRLRPLTADPNTDLVAGQVAMVNNVLRFYNGIAWANV